MLYHGTTSSPFTAFATATGRSDWSVVEGGVVYLTDDRDIAARYAGPHGYIAMVDAPEARPYRAILAEIGRNKASRYTRGVFVIPPHLIRGVRWGPSYAVVSARHRRKK